MGMPWSIIDAEPNLFGVTIPHVTIKWRCVCTDDKKTWYVEFPSMDVDFSMGISPGNVGNAQDKKKIAVLVSYPGRYGGVAGTYGHEQNHVNKGTQAAETYFADLKKQGKDFTSGTKAGCEFRFHVLEAGLKRDLVSALNKAMAHDKNFSTTQPVTPIGNVMPPMPTTMPAWAQARLAPYKNPKTGVIDVPNHNPMSDKDRDAYVNFVNGD